MKNNYLDYLKIIKESFYNICPFYSKDINFCKNKEGCFCQIRSEVEAYIKTVLPNKPIDFSRCEIYNFNGESSGKNVLDPKTFVDAKKSLWNYCFGNFPYAKYTREELDLHSILDHKLNNGISFIIHGRNESLVDENIVVKKAKGRTLVASIIMKESIRRRLFSKNKAISYNWVNFQKLAFDIQNSNNAEYIDNLSNTDWLCIDDIEPLKFNSDKHRRVFCNYLDRFFSERLDKNRPNILVCKFNLNDLDLSDEFGVQFAKICLEKENSKCEL